MEKATVEQCQELIGYQFTDSDILELALTHASLAPTRLESNERLEFLGDAILGFVVCHELYECQRELLEGDLTKIKSAVVSRQTCAEIVDETSVCQLLRLGKGMPEPARQFILRHVQEHIDQALKDAHQRNYKSVLQQFAQRRWGSTPSYPLLDEKGPDHSKCFEVAVSVNGQLFPSAWGRSKKEAEQEAAREALAELGLLAGDEGD